MRRIIAFAVLIALLGLAPLAGVGMAIGWLIFSRKDWA